MSGPEDLGDYARLYLCIPDDAKFEEIYDDDHHFAAYCRLLMIAEGPWPASAHLPMTARRQSVAKLADARIIDLQPGGRYRIHGLDAERERRAAHARKASSARWNARSNAPGNAPSIARASGHVMPSLAEHSQDETSTLRASIGGSPDGLHHVTEAVAASWSDATGRTVLASGDFAVRTLDDLCDRQGEASVLAAIPLARRQFDKIPSPQQLAAALRNHLEPLPAGRAVPVEEIRREPVPRRKAPEIDQAAYEAERRKLAGLAS